MMNSPAMMSCSWYGEGRLDTAPYKRKMGRSRSSSEEHFDPNAGHLVDDPERVLNGFTCASVSSNLPFLWRSLLVVGKLSWHVVTAHTSLLSSGFVLVEQVAQERCTLMFDYVH